MSYETNVAVSMNDLMSRLSTFAQANGWTEDNYIPEAGTTDAKLSLHNTGGDVYVHFAWNSSESNHIGVYQSLGYIGAGTNQWQHTDDSGNGRPYVPGEGGTGWIGPGTSNRFINGIGTGPYTSYFFFSGGGSEDYIHVVLEWTPGVYRHFGFGELEKSWDWTGGEYVYGHTQATGDPALQEILLASRGASADNRCATIHCENLPNEPVGSKWGAFGEFSILSSTYASRDGEFQVRFEGGAPGGMIGSVFNHLPSNSGDGFLPLSPNAIFYRDVAASPDNIYFMGFQPDIRTLNMKAFDPKNEVTVTGDTWKIFPSVRKQNTGDINESENLGIAYKKVV